MAQAVIKGRVVGAFVKWNYGHDVESIPIYYQARGVIPVAAPFIDGPPMILEQLSVEPATKDQGTSTVRHMTLCNSR